MKRSRNKFMKGILRNRAFRKGIILLILLLATAVGGIFGITSSKTPDVSTSIVTPIVAPTAIPSTQSSSAVELPSAADYDGKHAYITVNNNRPFFTNEEKTNRTAFETYSPLDDLGRCGVAYANICIELMPTEPRGEIGHIKPTGWHLQKYDIIKDKYLYNRCHLIGFQLAGENDNPLNLITGTRYLNIDGMLDAENRIANYVKDTHNHVLYRVTPIFHGNNLLAEGVLMEAWSVEDYGRGVCFNIFAFNVQPGIEINYADGSNHLKADP